LNRQVAWDSEYYVGIAVGGYADPEAGQVVNPATGQPVIKNYSFFPLYPYLMRGLAYPLSVLGLNPIATASLAGVVITLVGTLAGMVALWHLTQEHFGEDSAFRAVFYLLIFPTGFFLAQVYTEGLFIGLSFWCLLMIKRHQWVWATVLAVFAAWTRAHGAALALPLAVAWLAQFDWKSNPLKQIDRQKVLTALAVLLPLGAYLIWRNSVLGLGWAELQEFYFGRGLMTIQRSIGSWKENFFYARYMSEEGQVYFGIEILAILVATVSAVWLLRRDPAVALYSLAVILLSVFSGSAQSMARYMLIAPATFIVLGAWGATRAFDRTWTLASCLLMGMSAMLYSFDFWVG
jgi:Gpi18-like mannosyltransferase